MNKKDDGNEIILVKEIRRYQRPLRSSLANQLYMLNFSIRPVQSKSLTTFP
jgi:hypothetical protein